VDADTCDPRVTVVFDFVTTPFFGFEAPPGVANHDQIVTDVFLDPSNEPLDIGD
jgi:hypothetical protein